jgi:hypothetical protein
MRSLSIKAGLLLALIPVAAAFAASEGQDDKSYLPPAKLRAAPSTAPVANTANATVQRRRQRARVVRRRRAHRNYFYERYSGPRFSFFPF